MRIRQTFVDVPVTVAHRTSGVAPLHVFYDVIGDADVVQATTSPTGWAPEVDWCAVDYNWHFSDSGAGTWTHSGKPKTVAQGFMACHVFETPSGSAYRTKLFTVDERGRGYVYREDITVTDPDVVYASTTQYFSTSGSDGASGADAGHARKSVAAAMTYLFGGSGRRVLFDRGDTWDGANVASAVTVATKTGPFTIGAYGTGAKPVITFTGQNTNGFNFAGDVTDLRIMDLEIVGPYDNTIANVGFGLQLGENSLALRCTIRGFADGVNLPQDTVTVGSVTTEVNPRKNVAVVDCDLTGNYHYGFYGVGGAGPGQSIPYVTHTEHVDCMHFAVMGCTFNKVEAHIVDRGNSHFRIYASRAICEHNKFMRSHTGDALRALSGVDQATILPMRYVLFSDNWFEVSDYDQLVTPGHSTDQTLTSVLTIQPDTGQTGVDANKQIWHVIVENNKFTFPASGYARRLITIESKYTTVRNNLFDHSNYAGGAPISIKKNPSHAASALPEYARILHNTAYQPNAVSGFFLIGEQDDIQAGDGRKPQVYNNIVYAVSGPEAVINSGSVDAQANTLGDPGFTNAAGGVFTLLAALGSCVDSPVRYDFRGYSRIGPVSTKDRGAFEFYP